VLELELTAQDLAYTRFSLSPLWEVVASVRVLKGPAGHAVHHRWVDQVRPRLAGVDWRMLSDLVPVPSRSLPGFIAPPQPIPVPDLDLELAALRAVPATEVRSALDAGPHPRPGSLAVLHDDPPRGLALLAEAVQAYWEVALAPYWPRILSLLEGELVHRARLLAEGGAHRLLNDLDPAVTWDTDRLQVAHRYTAGTVRLAGRGLLLAPSVFIWPRVASIVTPPWQPTLRYPPRGIGTLWEDQHRDVPAALARIIGRSRAALLTGLDAPATTGTLARRSGLTPGGVSQHLTALRDAGLVTGHRTGRYVLYARTRVAEALLAGTPGAGPVA
jgi:DNA-binding transcriptional ArsR family regulator